MNKEIIDLLESIKVVPAEDDSEGNTCCKMKVSDYVKIDQVLALLKQQPPEGEMTKEIRLNVSNWEESLLQDTKDIRVVEIIKWLKAVCDRLDRAEASKADLLKICEEFMEIADDGSAAFDDPVPGSIFLRAEVVIAKAKQ